MADWYSSEWPYRKAITINKSYVSGETLEDFPILFYISTNADTDLQARTLTNGTDIIFTSGNGTTRLYSEIEYWNEGSGAIWVKVPSLSEVNNTIIYLYYGNGEDHTADEGYKPSGVWDDNYIVVYHMDDGGTTTYDSTKYGYNGSAYNNPIYGMSAQIYKGVTFDRQSYINLGYIPEIDSNTITVEAWVKTEWEAVDNSRIVTTGLDYTHKWVLGMAYMSGMFASGSTSTHSTPCTTTITDDRWHFLVGQKSYPNTEVIYLDGKAQVKATSDSWSHYNGAKIGAKGWTGTTVQYGFSGSIDEVRISDIVRSFGWIRTSYSSQSHPHDFLSIGSEENMPADLTEKFYHPGATHIRFPYYFAEAGEEAAPGVDGITFESLDISPWHVYYDMFIYYTDTSYIEGRCSIWMENNYSVSIGTWIHKGQSSLLRNHMVPGAVGELFQILGKPYYYDKTWEGRNTLRIVPQVSSTRCPYSNLYRMRDSTVVYVKNYVEHPIENCDWIEIKIEGYKSSNAS